MSEVNLRLQGLIQRLQQPIQDGERERLLDELTEQICRSGQLAYPPRGTLASSFYEDSCQQALQATLTEIRQKIGSFQPNDSIVSWFNKILQRKFNEIVTDEQIDSQLQGLAQTAQQHPPKSLERQRALNELVNLIRRSKRIGHPQRSLWASGVYEDLHSEALQETSIVVCQKIDTYNSEYPVMAWVNIILERRFSDIVKKYSRKGITRIPSNRETSPILSLDDLETFTLADNTLAKDPSNEACSGDHLVRDFLKNDPENLLRVSHVKDRPDITFQKVIWAKFVDDKTWEEISREMGIPIPTLSSFYQRTLRNLMPYFRKYLEG